MTQLKLAYLFILLGCLFIFSCKSEELFPKFEKDAMFYIHQGDSVLWKIIEFEYSDFATDSYDFSCLEDELITFYADVDEAKIVFSDKPCDEEPELTEFNFSVYYNNYSDKFSGFYSGNTIVCEIEALFYSELIGYRSFNYPPFSLLEACDNRLKFVIGTKDDGSFDGYIIFERVD